MDIIFSFFHLNSQLIFCPIPQDKPTADHSEHVKSLPDDPELTNTEEDGGDEENTAKQNDDNKKAEADDDSSTCNKPEYAAQVDQKEDTVKENHESTTGEPVKEDYHEHNQRSKEEGIKELPPTTEDSGVSAEQRVDDPFQLVSHFCLLHSQTPFQKDSLTKVLGKIFLGTHQ